MNLKEIKQRWNGQAESPDDLSYFFSHVMSDVDWLIARVEYLEMINKELEKRVDECVNIHNENERLQARVNELQGDWPYD